MDVNIINFSNFTSDFQNWLLHNGITIVVIIITSIIILKFGHIFIEKSIRKVVRQNGGTKTAEEQREDTLIQVLNITLNVIVITVSSLIIMTELGINIAPLLAGAGIAGVALGFGAQYLVKDVISGIFILLENQYAVGDVICTAEKCGSVKKITLRVTVLRDLDGVVHYIPNGEITIASNLTKSKSNVNLNVGVAYNSDLDKVEKVINDVGKELAKDKDWKDKIVEPPKVLRVDNLGDSSIEFKITGETERMAQWSVTGELRKRLKKAFDKNDIEIPFPQRDVHIRDKS